MKESEPGLYYPDGSFSSRQEIRTKLLMEELTTPLHLTSPAKQRTFEEWRPIIERRQAEYEELLGIPEFFLVLVQFHILIEQ